MSFSERRARQEPPWRVRAGAGLAVIIALFAGAGRAAAAPLDEPFIGGMSFDGPTSGNLAAVYWNPAALGLVRGFQLMVAGSGRLTTVNVNRAPAPTMVNGMPGGTMTFPSAQARDLTWPSPLGPNSFFGLSTDFGGDRFTIAFATYMPYLQRITFPVSAGGNEPTRYQMLALDLRNLLLAPALSIRFGNDFRVGFAPGFLFSTGRLMFAEDLALDGGSAGLNSDCTPGVACGAENPRAAARYDVSSGNDLGDAKFSVTLGAGIYYRRRSFELGVAYQSRPLGGDVPGVEVAGQHTTVTLPPRDPMGGGSVLNCPNGQSSRCIFGDVSYRLPDVWIAGATWRLAPGLELSAMVRWLWLSMHDKIDIRLSGPTLDANGHALPQHIVLWRGFKDVWDTRVRLSYWWRERVRVGAMLRVETSAVDTAAVNAAAVDGLKVEPVALIEFRLLRQLWLGGGYGVTFMRAVDVTDSVFKPELAPACVDPPTSGSLADPTGSCQGRLAGRARPTANGHYTAQTQDFGVTITLKF